MKKVTVSKFKAKFSEYAKEAIKGETFLVNGNVWSARPLKLKEGTRFVCDEVNTGGIPSTIEVSEEQEKKAVDVAIEIEETAHELDSEV